MFQLRTLAVSTAAIAGVAAAAVLPSSPFFAQEMEMPQPTEVHEKMLEHVGEWEGTIKSYTPGMPTVEAKATETVKAIGSFHTLADFQCDFMGMPYHGHGISSYDPKSKEMLATWSDSMSSYTAIMRGTTDTKSNTTEMRWEAPSMGSEDLVPHRSVTKYEGNSYETKFYLGEGDDEVETMTISMKRKR